MKAIVKETQEEVDVFKDAPAIYKEFKSIREWEEDELIFPDELKQIPKALLEGWIVGLRKSLNEERHLDSRNIPNDPGNPVISTRVAATISYYNGAEHVLNELEKLLNNI